jgi:hypothetical protein
MLLLLLLAMPATAMAHSVCLVRADVDMNCEADAVNDTVTVDGYVIVWKQFGNRGPGAIYDPSSGCCISIFDIDLAANQAIGTHVQVHGWIGPFNGLDEIVDNPANGAQDPIVTVLDPGPFTFPCTPVTCAQIADNSPNAEILESCCVRLCGTFLGTGNFAANTNYGFVDANGDTCEVRIDGDTDIDGTPIPTEAVDLIGVLGQFDRTGAGGTRVPCTGYQVLPRALTDFNKGTCTVPVEATLWGRVKSLYRDED